MLVDDIERRFIKNPAISPPSLIESNGIDALKTVARRAHKLADYASLIRPTVVGGLYSLSTIGFAAASSSNSNSSKSLPTA